MRICCIFLIGLAGAPACAAETSVPVQPWFPQAPALPAPSEPVLRVATVEQLFDAAGKVAPGGTVLVADGHYYLPRTLFLKTDRATLRSASGKRDAVILDGARSKDGELVAVSNCTGVTIADLTIQNIAWNGFKINSNTGVLEVTIYNCAVHNIWQRGVKGVPGVRKDGKLQPCRRCKVQYCLFYNDRPKRLEDDPYETKNPKEFRGNYIGGMDIMNGQGWVVSDNVFIGIHGLTGEARGAIFIWNQSSDCVIERNIIIDCDNGIYLGNGMRQTPDTIHCARFVVRNNFITRCPEGGITNTYTRECQLLHNTIHDPANKQRRSIRIVQDNDGLVIANNLISGPPITVAKNAGKVGVRDNFERPVSEVFVDAAKGNLHLTTKGGEVVGRGEPQPEVTEDIDRRPRGRKPRLGAHELTDTTGAN